MVSIESWREKAKRLRNEIYVLYFAFGDYRVPWYARAMTAITIAYALSPIDLIPDFIPILGYLDDLILIPAGIYLTVRMIPREVLAEYGQRTKLETIPGKAKWIAAVIIISLWLLVLYLILESIM